MRPFLVTSASGPALVVRDLGGKVLGMLSKSSFVATVGGRGWCVLMSEIGEEGLKPTP